MGNSFSVYIKTLNLQLKNPSESKVLSISQCFFVLPIRRFTQVILFLRTATWIADLPEGIFRQGSIPKLISLETSFA